LILPEMEECKNFIIITYNIHSFMHFEDRLEAVMQELDEEMWDIIVFTETWREERREVFETAAGHTWLGSGGARGAKGVGILLNKRWSYESFYAVSERVCAVDVRICGEIVRAVGVYMPHGGYDDIDVEAVYVQIENLLDRSCGRQRSTLIAGDFNAEVGRAAEHGRREEACQSARGQWLCNWCLVNGFNVVNTSEERPWDEVWTFKNGGNYKQLDYIMLDNHLQKKACSWRVMIGFTTGSDHRAVFCRLAFGRRQRPKRYIKKTASWNKHVDEAKYKSILEQRLGDHRVMCTDSLSKASYIEEQLILACEEATVEKVQEIQSAKQERLEGVIQSLIKERRGLSSADVLRKKWIFKQIRKMRQQRLKLRKEERIGRILMEFRSLKDISIADAPQKRVGISCVLDAQHNECNSKTGIAEAFASFYEGLYANRGGGNDARVQQTLENISPFTSQEFSAAVHKMKTGKARDVSGIVAEMIKHGGANLQAAILELFNDVLKPETPTPETWKRTRLTVIFKKRRC